VFGIVPTTTVVTSTESCSDETGARLTGDPDALADALVQLHQGTQLVPSAAAPATVSLYIMNPLASAGRSLPQWFSSHPEERVRRAARWRPGATALARSPGGTTSLPESGLWAVCRPRPCPSTAPPLQD
jgi:heat shock protein HtpX